jgi:hypothetical protein
MWVGANLSNMPKDRSGSPMVEFFPYQGEGLDKNVYYKCVIPKSDLGEKSEICDLVHYIAAYSKVLYDNGEGSYSQEIAWADGSGIISQGDLSSFFTFVAK